MTGASRHRRSVSRREPGSDQAKARLSALRDKSRAGEKVIITRARKPIARLMPIAPAPSARGVRWRGLKAARMMLAAHFDAHCARTI